MQPWIFAVLLVVLPLFGLVREIHRRSMREAMRWWMLTKSGIFLETPTRLDSPGPIPWGPIPTKSAAWGPIPRGRAKSRKMSELVDQLQFELELGGANPLQSSTRNSSHMRLA